MGITVTFQTVPILAVNCLSMRETVAILTFGDRGMAPLVTIDTVDSTVVGPGVRKIESLLQMAGPAKTGGNIAGRNNIARLVSRVAFQTIFCQLAL